MTERMAIAPQRGAALIQTTETVLLAVAVLTEVTCGIIQGFLGPILRQLSATLNVTAADLNWVSVANLLAGTALIPVLARLGDLHGRQRVLRWTMVLVFAGSVIVGLSRSMPVLLVGSMMQASMTACFPLLAGIVRERLGDTGTRRGLGFLVTSLVAGLAVGTVASGVVAHAFSDPIAALWVPAVATACSLVAVWRFVPEDAAIGDARRRNFDWAPSVLLSAGLALAMLAVGKGGSHGWSWGAPQTLGLLVGGVLLIAAWGAFSGRVSRAKIGLSTFRERRSAVVGLVSLAFAFCMVGPVIPNAVYLSAPSHTVGYGLGFTPLGVSLALIPNLTAMGIGTVAAPRVSALWSDRATLVSGSTLMAAGYLGILAGSRSRTGLLAALALVGLGCGLLQFVTRTLAVETAPTAATSTGSGINEIFITVGGSLGAAIVMAIQRAHTLPGHSLPAFGAFTVMWLMCAGVGLASAAVSLSYPARRDC